MNVRSPPQPKVLCYKLKIVAGEERWYLYKMYRHWFGALFNKYEPLGRVFCKAIYGVYGPDDFDGVIDDVNDLKVHRQLCCIKIDENQHLYAITESSAKQVFTDAETKHKNWAERNGYDFTTTIEGNIYTFKATERTSNKPI